MRLLLKADRAVDIIAGHSVDIKRVAHQHTASILKEAAANCTEVTGPRSWRKTTSRRQLPASLGTGQRTSRAGTANSLQILLDRQERIPEARLASSKHFAQAPSLRRAYDWMTMARPASRNIRRKGKSRPTVASTQPKKIRMCGVRRIGQVARLLGAHAEVRA